MKLTVKLKSKSSNGGDCNCKHETAEVLRDLADRLEQYPANLYILRDSAGKLLGTCDFKA